MGITDDADRLKILQQITTMRADLVTSSSSPTRRLRTPIKIRRFSTDTTTTAATTCPALYSGGGRGSHGCRTHRTSGVSVQGQGVPTKKYINIPIFPSSPRTSDSGPSVLNSPTTEHTSSDSQEGSRISTPDKQLQDVVISCEVERRQKKGLSNHFGKLHAVATLRYHNIRRLSRSLDHLFQVSLMSY